MRVAGFFSPTAISQSFFNCSPVLTDEASEFVPLGLSAWKEKSISPTRLLTCLRLTLALVCERRKRGEL